jgi:hypothetical protein
MANPLRQVHDAFWELLEAGSAFAALVPAGNRIKYDDLEAATKQQPEKDNIAPADTPEVCVRRIGTKPNLYLDSTEAMVTMRFAILVSTGRFTQRILDEVEWAIFEAMKDWRTHLESLTWGGTTFVRSCLSLETGSTLDDNLLNRGMRGWSARWHCQVVCVFSRTLLDPLHGTTGT